MTARVLHHELPAIVLDGATITGSGTAADPLVAAPSGAGVSTDGVTITGDGTPGTPLVATGRTHADGTTITGLGTAGSPLVAAGGGTAGTLSYWKQNSSQHDLGHASAQITVLTVTLGDGNDWPAIPAGETCVLTATCRWEYNIGALDDPYIEVFIYYWDGTTETKLNSIPFRGNTINAAQYTLSSTTVPAMAAGEILTGEFRVKAAGGASPGGYQITNDDSGNISSSLSGVYSAI